MTNLKLNLIVIVILTLIVWCFNLVCNMGLKLERFGLHTDRQRIDTLTLYGQSK